MAKIDFNSKKGFICDMDGVIYHGNIILPGVAEFINWLNEEKKDYLFRTVIYDGALPRKTFSMGAAADKRFYLECRKIR